ncbi:PAS domain S-box protein [Sulfurimonas sp. HSL3-7]|uniref:PAS domain-containing protein n=1 Tax=Sulfonitrofixus jiaomeiensis TaxID=3131938 RepID=UPI0031F7BB7C
MSEALSQTTITDQKEFFYDGLPMITETDLGGRITFVNRKFTEMSGYAREELLGRPHSIIRHPDMPAACFSLMWQTLHDGRSWQGYVKNCRKDGNFYWVIVHVTPKLLSDQMVGYIAVRKKPELPAIGRIKELYAKAKQLEEEGDYLGAKALVGDTARIDAQSFPQEEYVTYGANALKVM